MPTDPATVTLAGPITGSLDDDPTVSAAIAANPKSAFATTEFIFVMFLNLICSAKACGIIAAGGEVAQLVAFATMAGTNGIYIWARTSLKKAHVGAVATVQVAALTPVTPSNATFVAAGTIPSPATGAPLAPAAP